MNDLEPAAAQRDPAQPPGRAQPGRDQQPQQRPGPGQATPQGWWAWLRGSPVTLSLIGLTAAVFLAQLLSQLLLGGDLILALGAKVNELIAAGELWRLVTPIFIHAGFGHLFINMYSLYALGPAVERSFGPGRALALYLLCGISGVLLSLLFSPYPSVGASGAIFGLLGALGAFLYLNRSLLGALGRFQLRQIVFVALINLALGLSPGIDNWGHLGGLIFGAGLGWFAGPQFEVEWTESGSRRAVDRRPWERAWPVMLAASALLALSLLAALS